ncbi:hypothetical protein N7465_002983 [Penicillium sp. CMV-2018d]|nr:hypothetical protein N7465_002983 [Penicillium sp. CMV-2018d]
MSQYSDEHLTIIQSTRENGRTGSTKIFFSCGSKMIGSSHLQDEVNSETWSLDYVGLASLENFKSADPTTPYEVEIMV